MMNTKQRKTMSLAVVGMALLTAVLSIPSPTQALALGHWNLDEDFTPSSGPSEDGMDRSGTTDNSKEEDEDSTTATTTDDDEEDGSRDSSDDLTSEEEDPTQAAYQNLQACLSDNKGEGSPTEQEVQDCIDSSYSGRDSGGNPSNENTVVDEDEKGVTEPVSTDDSEDEEDGPSEE